MYDQYKKESISKIPALLAQFLELPKENINIRKTPDKCSSKLIVDVGKYIFVVEFKNSSARTQLFSTILDFRKDKKNLNKKKIPLVAVPYMGETGRRLCDEFGFSWLDLSGNARIKAPGLLIHIEGRPNRFKSAGRPSNIFAPKSSRITRIFLINPDREFTQRQLSRKTALDEGFISRIVRRLEQDGLIIKGDNGAVWASDLNQLLDAWHERYDFSRHHIIKGHIAARSGNTLLFQIAETLERQKIAYAATGLSAAWLFTRHSGFRLCTFFFHQLPEKEILDALKFREEARGANTWFVVANDEGIFQGAAVREGIWCVHPIQIYLDLKGHPERSSEAAAKLRKDYLTWRKNA